MLKFTLKNILALRGITHPLGFLAKTGFDYAMSHKLLKAESPSIKIKHIEQICVALNCTPNDLFEWKRDTNTVLPDSHSLNRLNNGEGTRNLQEMVKDIPSDKLALIEKIVNELKKDE
jgi:DNA-binding Xre family transcriptional regulator